MHEKSAFLFKNRAPMIRYRSQKQQSLAEFDWPFQTALDENNRWVKLSQCIPWDELAEGYYRDLEATQGRPTKDARLVIGAVIIKHKLCLSDRETVAQIQENPYLQYFVGLQGYQMEVPFVPSLLVEIRKRMGTSVFDVFQSAIIASVEKAKAKQKKTSVTVRPGRVIDSHPEKRHATNIVTYPLFQCRLAFFHCLPCHPKLPCCGIRVSSHAP